MIDSYSDKLNYALQRNVRSTKINNKKKKKSKPQQQQHILKHKKKLVRY